jgi:tRNA (cytidine/uridine-2'-O-)-methyltransferase
LGCALDLIRPLGFDTSVKALRRAGLDYWPRLAVREHESWEAFQEAEPGRPLWLLSSKASRPVWDAPLALGDALVFGSETSGLPPELLARHAERVIGLPMVPKERSLNLATAVCAVLCEGVRQLVCRGEVRLDEGARIWGKAPNL